MTDTLFNLTLKVGAVDVRKQVIYIPQKDKGYDLAFNVQYSNAVVYNLTNYNVNLKTWAPSAPGTLLVNNVCSAVNAMNGTCNYTLKAGDFNTVGIYYAELEATNSNVIVASTETFKIIVAESG